MNNLVQKIENCKFMNLFILYFEKKAYNSSKYSFLWLSLKRDLKFFFENLTFNFMGTITLFWDVSTLLMILGSFNMEKRIFCW